MKLILLAIDEVLRLFSTRRGLLSIIGFSLIWLAVMMYGVLPTAQVFQGASESGLLELLLPAGNAIIQQWPAPELAVYWLASLFLLPFLAVMTAADQTASDRSRGTLRFLVLRCSRLEIFFGRYLGQLIILSLVVLVTLGSVLLVIAVYSAEVLPQAIAVSPIVILNLIVVLAPFIALMALVSILARSAFQAIIFAVVIWLLTWFLIVYLKTQLLNVGILARVLPGSQISELLKLASWQTLSLAPIPIVTTVVLLLAGSVIMVRRDL